jgi:hypothetical protein
MSYRIRISDIGIFRCIVSAMILDFGIKRYFFKDSNSFDYGNVICQFP